MNEKEKTEMLIEHLQGTCMTLEEGLKNLNLRENEIDLSQLENWILRCDGCGWWYETGVNISDELCDDCEAEFYDDHEEEF